MESAARYFEVDGLPHFGCLAHKLNLVIQDALKEIGDTLTKVQSLQELYDPVKKLAEKLKEGMKTRLGNLERNETISLSTILDPRFKLKAIKNKEQIEHLKNILKIKIINEINSKNQPVNSGEPVPSSSSSSSEPATSAANPVQLQTLSLWSEFDTETDKEFSLKTSDVGAAEELDKYLADNLIKRTERPLKY
ncbi:unnamed protein product [Parnassius apollo]|uniref:(apollo) hypothetical protein n=1 Tax=Parnassius apollo TaxID=110799 RepID=A0A8S3W5D9_PARAO|nr:unnamed protein product [Parnassius apollo]